MSGSQGKLCAGKFGFAFGLIWGLGIFLLGIAGTYCAFGLPFIHLWGSIYHGYTATLLGSVYGGLWGFVDFFIFGWLVALVYNCGCKRNS